MSPKNPRHLKRTLSERFWEKVDRSGDCWAWIGHVGSEGYGYFRMPKRPVYAHRMSYELANGAIPDGLVVMHKCDNPRCVRPEHLALGTQSENIRDCFKRGRANRTGQRTPKALKVEAAKMYEPGKTTQPKVAAALGITVRK